MYQLSLSNASGGLVHLAGSSVAAPIAGGRYIPSAPAAAPVAEVIEVFLEGAAAETGAMIATLQSMLADAGRETNRQYLWYTPAENQNAWRSRCLGGWVEGGSSDGAARRDLGAQAIRLHVLRDACWEAAEENLLPLSNGNGTGVTGGLTIFNHDDSGAGHDNFVTIGSDAVNGDLPAGCRIELQHTLDSGRSLGDVFIYANNRNGYSPVLEGESGSGCAGCSLHSDAASSNGQFIRLPWNATSETDLLSWSLGSLLLNNLGSRMVVPVLRFSNPPAYTDLWLRLQVRSAGVTLAGGAWLLAPADRSLVTLPRLALPPGNLGLNASYAALTLALCGQKESAGTYALDVDSLALAPLDGERALLAIQPLPYGWSLVDDGIEGILYGRDAGGNRLGTHAGLGTPLTLIPGKAQTLYFHHREGTGCDIAHRLRVKMWCRARRRYV